LLGNAEETSFFTDIATGDETWVHGADNPILEKVSCLETI